jgi:hypothetical protein
MFGTLARSGRKVPRQHQLVLGRKEQMLDRLISRDADRTFGTLLQPPLDTA